MMYQRYSLSADAPSYIPSSLKKTSERGPIAPTVSIATGTKEWATGRPAGLLRFSLLIIIAININFANTNNENAPHPPIM